MKPFQFLIGGALLALAVNLAQAGETVAEFKGSESTVSGEFEVDTPWILDWRVTSSFETSLAIEVNLIEAGTLSHVGTVLKTKSTGNGVRLFQEAGRFAFRVDSTFANWTLKVEQLTPQEAELYTPKTKGLDY